MTAAVLDSSVVLKWFRPDERHAAPARRLRERFTRGELTVVVPTLIEVEMLNVAARGWGLGGRQLVSFARRLGRFGFDVRDPELEHVARWAARGLSAYDATYVALAESDDVPLVTDDEGIPRIAGSIAVPLAGI